MGLWELQATPILKMNTVNVDLFALYINYCRVIRPYHISAKICTYVNITFLMSYRGNDTKNANINPCEITNFLKTAKIYARENIYAHSNNLLGS